jgi:CRP-like cAMP-binding protein
MVTAHLLSQISLFEGLSKEQLEGIARHCEELTCPQGEILFREGKKAGRLYILLEGEVTIQIQPASHPKTITVEVSNQADNLIGWSGLVAPFYYTASAICREESRLVALDGQALLRVLGQDPVMGFVISQRISEVISNRLRSTRIALSKTREPTEHLSSQHQRPQTYPDVAAHERGNTKLQ